MFCSNCGKQIPDNTMFCNHCGAQQPTIRNKESAPIVTENQQKNANMPLQKPEKTPKKKTSILVVLVVVLCAFLLGKFVIAPSMLSDSGNDDGENPSGESQLLTENDSDSSNPVYDAIFTEAYIVRMQTFFGMETNNYAMKKDDGIIYCADYGYKDDVVKEWVETMYIPVSEYTDTQKAELENSMKSQFATIDAFNCCVVTYEMSTNYFTITCTYSDVDKAENYAELYNAKILKANTHISMSGTETGLLEQGFVKK